MERIQYVHRCEESGELQFRQDIPADLQEVVGKKVIRRSLNTRNEEEIKHLAASYAAENEETFRKLRGGQDKAVDPGVFSYLLYCCRDRL